MSKADRELLESFKGCYQSDLRWLKASRKALQAMPGSPRQREYQAQMKAIEDEYKVKNGNL